MTCKSSVGTLLYLTNYFCSCVSVFGFHYNLGILWGCASYESCSSSAIAEGKLKTSARGCFIYSCVVHSLP